jgi:hypothetical protein
MTIRLAFDLATVREIAEFSTLVSERIYPASLGRWAALRLSSGSDGVWLASNLLPAQPAPADQPGRLDRQAAFARRCPSGTPWLEQIQRLRGPAPLAEVLPLYEPAHQPLLNRMRNMADAGHTTLTVLLFGTGVVIPAGPTNQSTHDRHLAR